MTVLSVPFHLDERLPAFAPPVPPDEVIAPDLPPGPPWERMAVLYAEVADAVGVDELQVVLSGDCTTSLAVVAGLQRSGVDPAIVWFDAHGDLQTPETSTSGYLGGFPVRQLVGGSDRTVPDALGLAPVRESDVLLVDARDLDPPEAEFLASSAIRRVGVGDVLDALPDGPVHLHLDADVVDPRDLPGLLFPAPDGPRWSEAGRRAGGAGDVPGRGGEHRVHLVGGRDARVRGAGPGDRGIGALTRDIIEMEVIQMTDILIRDLSDDVVAALDARAQQQGLSRSEYLRRKLAQDLVPAGRTTVEDLEWFAETFADLRDPEVMRRAWE